MQKYFGENRFKQAGEGIVGVWKERLEMESL